MDTHPTRTVGIEGTHGEELTAPGVPLLVRSDKEDAWTAAGVIVEELRARGLV